MHCIWSFGSTKWLASHIWVILISKMSHLLSNFPFPGLKWSPIGWERWIRKDIRRWWETSLWCQLVNTATTSFDEHKVTCNFLWRHSVELQSSKKSWTELRKEPGRAQRAETIFSQSRIKTFSQLCISGLPPLRKAICKMTSKLATLFPALDIILDEFPRCAGWARKKRGKIPDQKTCPLGPYLYDIRTRRGRYPIKPIAPHPRNTWHH